ncbi:hypothetical protein PoB_002095200 [Plakobranchus ocellatus]|uniref:Uncharacterized protein n=1 Tax=Plakobranchus ocellatus TaxID=259542 RepID=A0AAV3ZIT3_9GAST|nr:hypothetical protein PoB_002095200 [Plakobranchus ocellatus]
METRNSCSMPLSIAEAISLVLEDDDDFDDSHESKVDISGNPSQVSETPEQRTDELFSASCSQSSPSVGAECNPPPQTEDTLLESEVNISGNPAQVSETLEQRTDQLFSASCSQSSPSVGAECNPPPQTEDTLLGL